MKTMENTIDKNPMQKQSGDKIDTGGTPLNIEIRGSDSAVISGYVNAVERKSKVLCYPDRPPFREIVRAGTFKKALERADCVELRLDHTRTLCDTRSGLELHEDNIGLHATVTVTDRETVEAAKNGQLTGWSFGFCCLHENVQPDEGGIELRELDDIELSEVSILSKKTPAYIATSVEVRDDGKPVENRHTEGKVSVKYTGSELEIAEAEIEILSFGGNRK